MKNPIEFPLCIYLGKGDDKDMRLITKFPNSSWVPRMSERLVLPKGERSGATEWLLVTVDLVVHDLVGQVVNVFCEKIKSGAITRKQQDLNALLERLEAVSLENIDEELAKLKTTLLE
ncbi:hypothetical protein [uncultured Nostoc sp.]|uniref:hypothetical protein n=1 Tax=uncultured Nostoc sp. TaxID=340711 RepID=UPI0035CA6C04